MGRDALEAEVPFVWPDPSVLTGPAVYGSAVPLAPVLESADLVFGVVSGLAADAVAWLTDLVRRKNQLRVSLLVALQPACPTREADLQRLYALAAALPERVEFRILVSDELLNPPSTILACLTPPGPQRYLAIGPTPNLGLSRAAPGHANLVFEPDAVLFEAWRSWFESTWPGATPLTPETTRIPPLVPATGTPEAADMWKAYVRTCREAAARQEGAEPGGDAETGEATVLESDEKASVTDRLGIPRLDELEERLRRLYQAGDLVAIDGATRIPPFDVPIKPEWFGVKSLRRVGAVARQVRYRISALDDETRHELERKRTMTRTILDMLSFPMGEGVR